MTEPTLRHAERFHHALALACSQCGADMRYLGGIANATGPGAQQAAEAGVWLVTERGRLGPALGTALSRAPRPLFRLRLATSGGVKISVAGTPFGVIALPPMKPAAWPTALRAYGVDDQLFLHVLRKTAA
jgi:hypothetical protein